MTTYGSDHYGYVPESSFEAWLDKRGYPESYRDIFSWDRQMTHTEYERLFDGCEQVSEQLDVLKDAFEEAHQERIAYMQEHGIEQWSDLNPEDDKEQLGQKDVFFEKIASIHQQRTELEKIRASSFGALPLLAGVLDGSYAGFDKLCDDERQTHAMMSTNSADPMWDWIGPLRNSYWSMYPRIEI